MRISFLFAALLVGQSCDLVAGRIEIDGGPGYEVHEIFDEVGAASLASAACEGDIADLAQDLLEGLESGSVKSYTSLYGSARPYELRSLPDGDTGRFAARRR